MALMKIADNKYFLAFLLFTSMLSPSCNSDKKPIISKATPSVKKMSDAHNPK